MAPYIVEKFGIPIEVVDGEDEAKKRKSTPLYSYRKVDDKEAKRARQEIGRTPTDGLTLKFLNKF